MILLNIDGRDLSGLDISSYSSTYELLDGEGTGRTNAPTWDLIRDCHGMGVNFQIEIARPRSDDDDFRFFMQTFMSLRQREFVRVIHTDMLGEQWNQEMYYIVRGVSVEKFDNDFIYLEDVQANFIFRRGIL